MKWDNTSKLATWLLSHVCFGQSGAPASFTKWRAMIFQLRAEDMGKVPLSCVSAKSKSKNSQTIKKSSPLNHNWIMNEDVKYLWWDSNEVMSGCLFFIKDIVFLHLNLNKNYICGTAQAIMLCETNRGPSTAPIPVHKVWVHNWKHSDGSGEDKLIRSCRHIQNVLTVRITIF